MVTTSRCSLLLIYRPRKDERLSWPSWLTYSGWFTHISGHPSAVGRVQDSESSPVKDQRSTTEARISCISWLHRNLQSNTFYRQHGSLSLPTDNVNALRSFCLYSISASHYVVQHMSIHSTAYYMLLENADSAKNCCNLAHNYTTSQLCVSQSYIQWQCNTTQYSHKSLKSYFAIHDRRHWLGWWFIVLAENVSLFVNYRKHSQQPSQSCQNSEMTPLNVGLTVRWTYRGNVREGRE